VGVLHGLQDAAKLPEYTPRGCSDRWLASFKSGVVVPASVGRLRRYPGLPGIAPTTRFLYESLLHLAPELRVLDAGAGSGEGARMLAEHFAQVTGVDKDHLALRFAREYAPRVHWQQADLVDSLEVGPQDLAVFIDVLGQVADPYRALRRARRVLGGRGRVFIAEPQRSPIAEVLSPQRREFTQRTLAGLVRRAGLRVADWLCVNGGFLVLIAEVDESPESVALGDALDVMPDWRTTVGGGDLPAQALSLAGCERRADPALRLEILLAMAELSTVQGDLQGARNAYLCAQKLDPEDCRSWTGLAGLCLRSGDLELGWDLAAEALTRSPSDATATRVFAEAMQRLGAEDALDAWLLASDVAPDDVHVASRAATLAARQGQLSTAVALFDRLERYGDQRGVEFCVTYAWLLLVAHRTSDACCQARRATLLCPTLESVSELWSALDREAGPPVVDA
jgi:SAM-dependent methyltransferase